MKKIAFVAVLIAVIVFGIVAYASAAGANQTITINAKVNPKFTMTVTPTAAVGYVLNWSAVDLRSDAIPERTEAIAIDIDSNRDGDLTVSWPDGAPTEWHLTNSLSTTTFTKRADNHYDDTITFNPDYNTPSLDANAVFTLQYSAVQD